MNNSTVHTENTIITAKEYALKVAYIFNFTKFIDWPEFVFKSKDEPFRLCATGNDIKLKTEIKKLESKTVGNRKIIISDIADSSCHLLFISNTESLYINTLINKVKNAPVLTIGEDLSFISKGGFINFYNDGNNIKFEINNTEAQKHGLIISSKLLKIAKVVEQ